MSEQSPGFWARMGSWFTGGKSGGTDIIRGEENSILRPNHKRDRAIANLQNGFTTLTELMSTINTNLNDQNRRQDELLSYLSHLPKAIEGIPETNRLQVESLKAISARLDQQTSHQNLIGEILGKLADNDSAQQKAVEGVRDRVETVAEQNKVIAENLSTVGSAMQTVSKNSSASAAVLEQVRDNLENRDGQLERLMQKQAQRFTYLLTLMIFLLIAAIAAVTMLMVQMNNKTAPTSPATTAPGSMHAVE